MLRSSKIRIKHKNSGIKTIEALQWDTGFKKIGVVLWETILQSWIRLKATSQWNWQSIKNKLKNLAQVG